MVGLYTVCKYCKAKHSIRAIISASISPGGPDGSDGGIFQSADVTLLLASSNSACGIAWSNNPEFGIGLANKGCAVG